MDWGILYIIRKLLERRCLKWACMTHLDIWNISYGQKKGLVSNWQFDSWPLKVNNHPDFLACKWHTTYCWKALNEGYNFALDLISIGNLHAKLWAPKITGVLVVRISRFPLGNPKTKCHLDVGFVERHKIYYKGEGGGFPKSGPWWILWVRVAHCRNPNLAKCGGEAWKSWGFGVLRDSRMFRARQQGPKHLALGCSWCHWKGLEA
jgi:hypothetical protein